MDDLEPWTAEAVVRSGAAAGAHAGRAAELLTGPARDLPGALSSLRECALIIGANGRDHRQDR